MSGHLVIPLASAFELADHAGADDGEAYVAQLPAEHVVGTLFTVTQLRTALTALEKMLKSRMAAEAILSSGETWTAPDGSEYFYGGDRSRECSDPAALREQLSELPLSPIARIALRAAFKDVPMKVYLTEIDKIERFGGPEAGRVIRSFISWRESAPKLRPREVT